MISIFVEQDRAWRGEVGGRRKVKLIYRDERLNSGDNGEKTGWMQEKFGNNRELDIRKKKVVAELQLSDQ